MTGFLLAIIVVGIAIVALLGVVVAVLGPVRRFSAAAAALRVGLVQGAAPLRVLMNSRHRSAE